MQIAQGRYRIAKFLKKIFFGVGAKTKGQPHHILIFQYSLLTLALTHPTLTSP